jgi:hypothetical protein
MQQRCNEKAKRILADHSVAPKSDAVLEEIGTILEGKMDLRN